MWVSVAFSSNAFQKHASGLVIWVLRHEFAAERFSEDRLVEMVDQLAGVGCVEARRSIQRMRFNSADNFALSLRVTAGVNAPSFDNPEVQIWLHSPRSPMSEVQIAAP